MNDRFGVFKNISEKSEMKRSLKAVIVVLLMMCVMLGNMPFGTMLLCVHSGGGHGEKAVHLHFGQLPGQPCEESPRGLQHVAGDEDRRHFSLAPEILMNGQTSPKRLLSLLSSVRRFHSESSIDPSTIAHGGYCLEDPSLLFPDAAFTSTTILII